MANWYDLPLDILCLIAQQLSFIEDFVSFGAVSKACHSITVTLKNKASLPPRYPQLMLAEDKDVPNRGFLNLLTSKTNRVKLPEASGRTCIGALNGWLFTLGSDLQINLLHPFSGQQICLPPMLTLPDQYEYDEDLTPQEVISMFVSKIAMSASPLKGDKFNDECVIVVIYGEFKILAFARLGETVWTNIQVPSRCYDDVAYYKGKFYAVDCHGITVVIDIQNAPKATVVAPAPPSTIDPIQKYLVESSGDLLLVSRIRKGILFGDEDKREDHVDDKEVTKTWYYTNSFSIFKLDESHDDSHDYFYKLEEVTTIGDRALFLGKNVSTSTPSSDCVKANCIYFTDDNSELYRGDPGGGGGHDTGIFNMKDGNVHFDYAGESRCHLSPPLWYI